MSKPAPYPYPEIDSRDPADAGAALGAFRRLYEHALATDNTALAVFAAYKALQKVEGPTNSPFSDINIPVWVSDAMWLALQTYIMNLRHRLGRENKQKTLFRIAMKKFLREYQRWYLVHDHMGRTGRKLDPATHDLARKGAGKRVLEDAYRFIEKHLSEANARVVFDDKGSPLPAVSARDLVPTRRLLDTLGEL
jgi:hypothetical protein